MPQAPHAPRLCPPTPRPQMPDLRSELMALQQRLEAVASEVGLPQTTAIPLRPTNTCLLLCC